MDKQPVMRSRGVLALGLLLWTVGLAFGQATTVVTATADLNGSNGPQNAYDHQDMIYAQRGQVSLREALTYGNQNRIKVGRQVCEAADSSAVGAGAAGQAWSGGPVQEASPFSCYDTDMIGGSTNWYRLGNTVMPPGALPAAPYFTGLPNWGNNGSGGGNAGVPGDNSSGTGVRSRVLVNLDNAGYGQPHNITQSNDNNDHNNVQIAGHGIRFQNLGFNIPSGTTITGIDVNLYVYTRNGPEAGPSYQGIWTNRIQMLKAGAAVGGSQASGRGNDTWSGDPDAGTPAVLTYGPSGAMAGHAPSGALWGTTWSPADINDPTFGFVVATTAEYSWHGSNDANNAGRGEQWAIIDHVEVIVYVNPSPSRSALIKADDTQRIGCALTAGQHTQQLVMRDWRYNQPTQLVPDDARITGIACRIVRCVDPGVTAQDTAVVLQRPVPGGGAGLDYSPTSKTSGGNWPVVNPSGYETAGTYGTATDTWGFTDLTGADINDPRFGVCLVGTSASGGNIYVNYVEMSIWWEDPIAGTQYIHNDLTITLDAAKTVVDLWPLQVNPFAQPTPQPAITRDNVTLNGEINGDGAPDLSIACGTLATNTPAPTGVLTQSVSDLWANAGLRVGLPATRVQNVVIEGVQISGSATSGSSAWVPAVWLINGHNIKLVNSDVTNCGIGVLTSVGVNGGVPDKAYVGSQTPGSECSVSNCVNAGIYTVGSGQTLVQRTTISDNGTSPGGLDPYSANVVLAGTGDNVLGGTANGANNTIRRAAATITSIAGSGYGVTVPGTGQNTIQNNTITNHLAPGVWICSNTVTGLPTGRTKPFPTIVGGSATNAGNTITNNGVAPATSVVFTNHAGVWVTGLAGDDSANPTASPYKDDYNLIQGNTITGSGGAGIFLDGPGKSRVGGVATTARNTISNSGSLDGANGVEESGIEIHSTGQHYGDRLHPLQTANPNEVFANIIENNNITNNRHGINIIGTDDNLIGGAQAASLNAIANNSGDGIRIQGSGDTVVTGNYIGVARDGGGGANGVNGVEVTAGATGDNQIGGQSVSERNVISGNNSNGISILGSDGDMQDADPTNDNDGSNRIVGNYIGLTPSGVGTRGNGGNGIAITQQATGVNRIGGSLPGERNFIGGNTQYGVSIEGDASGGSNVVKGNFVGLDDGDQTGGGATMPHAAGNGAGGVLVNAAAAQIIGGSVLGEGNFISANAPDSNTADGVQLTGAGSHIVLGNAIGGRPLKTSGWPADPSLTTTTYGNNPFANGGAGVFVDTASIGNITIGGTGPNDGNTIVWNRQQGVNMAGTGIATVINNLIGAGPTAASGSSFVDLGNNSDGILISGAGANVIGGVAARQANVISGNGGHGINIPATGNNTVTRNKIGTDDTGQAAIGNDGDGVRITGTGTNVLSANTLSGNVGSGVYFRASGALTMAANFVGTNVSGDDTTQALASVTRAATAAVANRTHGVYLPAGHTGKLVLGDGSNANRNVIGGNTQSGVHVQGGQINDLNNNYIGVSSDGTLPVANGGDGVYIENWVSNHAPAGATTDITLVSNVITWGNAIRGNAIGGNRGNGVNVRSGSTVIWGNTIGSTRAGAAGAIVGNTGAGILINDMNLVNNRQSVVIGVYPEQPATTTSGNLITGNGSDGVRIMQAGGASSGSILDDVLIRGNSIGVYGTLAAGNAGNGVYVDRAVTGRIQIGDATTVALDRTARRNVIGRNTLWGINYKGQYTTTGSPNNAPLIYDNFIGTDDTGNVAAGNVAGGVLIDVNDATRAVRVGDDPANPDTGRSTLTSSNVISGNTGPAISFSSPARGYVYGNAIGLSESGSAVVGNGGEGVLIDVTAASTVTVGGADGTHRLRNIFVGNGTAATAGNPRPAVAVRTGLVNIVDNLFGWHETGGRVPQLIADGGNDGGGVWLGQPTALSSTFTIPAATTVEASGAANGQPGVRLDTDIAFALTDIPVHGGFGPGYEIRADGNITLTNCDSANNAGDGVLVDASSGGNLVLDQTSLTSNGQSGLDSAGTGGLTFTTSPVNGNGGGGVKANAPQTIVFTTSPVTSNTGGGGVVVTGPGTGTLTLTDSAVTGNAGLGLSSTSTGAMAATNGPIRGNTGGGVVAAGQLALTDCPVGGATAGQPNGGNGVLVTGTGTVTLTRSDVIGNSGGGVLSSSTGLLTLVTNPVTGNTGGIGASTAGGAVITDSPISTNGGNGVVASGTGAVTLTRSAVSDNTGGGVLSSSTGLLTLDTSPITHNTGGHGATTAGGVLATDSAISQNGGDGVRVSGTAGTSLTRSAVTNNTGGGVLSTSTGAMVLATSPVTSNTGGIGVATNGGAALTDSPVTSNGGTGLTASGAGNVTLTNSEVRANTAGGLVTSHSGIITLDTSPVTSNTNGVGISATTNSNITLTNSAVGSNGGAGISSTGTAAISLTGSSVTSNTGDGVAAGGSVTLATSDVTGNQGDGVTVTGAGAISAPNVSISTNTGAGVRNAGSGGTTITGGSVDSNGGPGVVVTGSGALTFTNAQANTNGTGATRAPGLSLTGSGTYVVRQSTITGNGSDGIVLGVAGGQNCGNASIGLSANSEFLSNSTVAGKGSGNNANLITTNGGWGVNIARGTGCVVRGNMITDNVGGGINGPVVASPNFYFNGLVKSNPTTIVVGGKAPANTRVEIYEAKDLAINVPSLSGHQGQVQKRLAAVNSDAAGVFSVDVPTSRFIQADDNLKLVTGLIIDATTGNTTTFARNTGQPNLVRVNGNPVQSRITVNPKTVQAENITGRQTSTVTLALADVLGTPLAGVSNASLHVASPNPHTFVTMVPAEGTAQTTSAPSGALPGGTITAAVSATDRVNCANTVVTFGAAVAGVSLDPVDQPASEVLTITAGNPEVTQTTLAVDPFADPNTEPVADGVFPAVLRISIHDNSASHCVLSGFSRDRVRVVQISGPAGGTATIGTPPADSDANGQLTVQVTATKAGSYVFGVQTDVAGDGFQSPADDMPAANNQTVVFKVGPIDASRSDVTADKTTVLANGGKRVNGAADAVNTVTFSLTVYDGLGNAPIPNLPASDILITGAAVGSSTPYTPADGVVVTVNGPTNANGQTTASVTSTLSGIIEFTTRVVYRGTTTALADKPQVDFRDQLSVANSSVTISNASMKADDTDTSTITITVKDGSDAASPVAGVPASAITITPNPAAGVVISGLTATNAQGVATATIKGNMPAVPVDVTFTVNVAWPAAGQPAAGVKPVPSITLSQQPTIRFVVGDGSTIVLTADRTTMRPNGRDAATLTALLTDRLNHPIPGQTVTLSVADGRGVAVVQPSTTTGSAGTVTATVTATQRNVPGAVIQASLVPAGGTPVKLAEITLVFRYPDPDPARSTLTFTADNPLLGNNLAKVTGTIEMRDSVGTAGDPIPGIDPARFHVDVFQVGTTTAATGVTVNLPTVATDANGQTTFTATSTKAQTVTFRARVDREDGSGQVTIAQTFDVEYVGFVVQTYTPGLHMMGVGALPRDPRPQAVLANASNFDLATWLGAQQTYMLYSPAQTQAPLQMVPGRGFWLQLQDYLTLTVVGDLTDQTQPFPVASAAPMAMSQGWNMVANPYPVPYNFTLSRIDVYRNGGLVGNLGTAAAQALVEPYAWRWDPALQYLLMLDPSVSASGNVSGTVQPGRGFWWLVNQPGVSVRLQAPVASGRAETRAAATAGSWVATIDATTEGGSSQVFLGAGDKRLRAAAPPDAPVTPVVRAEIVDDAGRAASDVRTGPFTKKQLWSLNVTAAKAGDVTLSWKGLTRALPAHHRLTLVDPTNGQRVVMNSRAAYTYSTSGGTRAFNVELDPHGSRGLNITDVHAGATRSRAQGVPIAVTLTADAKVVLTVKGLGGRVVRQLTVDGASGSNALSWDGKDADGRLVPAGSYIVEVTAYTEEGEMAKQVVNLTVR
ncbi:MAG: right-handed parallel beta-helix repeat-containing protein [Armatimonadetes bacterium]|nr:right-handed parallel beta-helix repeat-containing protein [Armatimonadota bacterium]